MHVLYVHQNFPAQFGHIARHLVEKHNYTCSFVSETPAGNVAGIEKIQYQLGGGATTQNHFCTRSFENAVWHSEAVYRAMQKRPDIKPDLIVGHSGFGSTLFLRELYPNVPIVNFFEYFYLAHDPESDMDFRTDLNWPVEEIKYLRSRCRNAMILLDLENCDLGYTPTKFQKSKFPTAYDSKLKTVFDGVDQSIYHAYGDTLRPSTKDRADRQICGVNISPTTRVVTYVSRGFESMRGFDIFMKSAKRIAEQYPDVHFFVVGTDRIAYGGDDAHIGGKSFKQWVMESDSFPLDKMTFTGRVPSDQLGRLLATSDLHIYLTVPFVLSWSMMDAMSCGAVVLGSDTPPVREMIRHGENGLLADFFNPDDFAAKAIDVLKDPDAFRHMGNTAEKMITERYSLQAVLPDMFRMYEEAIEVARSHPRPYRSPPNFVPSPASTSAKPLPPKENTSRPGAATPVKTGKTPATPSKHVNKPSFKSPFFG